MGERGHPVTAPGLLAGCILEAAAHPGEGGGTDHTLHGRARRPGRSPRVAQPSRSTSTQRAPPAPTQPPSPPRRHAVHPVSSCVAARGCTQASRQVRLAGGGGAGPAKERGACQTEAVHHGHPSPSSRRGGTTLAPSEGVVSRETRSSAMPSDSACLPTAYLPGRTHSRRSPPGGSLPPAGFVVASSATRRPPQRPAGRQPFRAVGAPRPAISAAASRYATAPAEAGS